MAFITPISLVLSITEMNMVFAIPTPATTKDMEAMPPTTKVRIENIEGGSLIDMSLKNIIGYADYTPILIREQ